MTMSLSFKEGVNKNKDIYRAISSVKGLGYSVSKNVANSYGFQKNYKVGSLNSQLSGFLETTLSTLPTPTSNYYNDFIKKTLSNIKQSGSYRGQRLLQALPARGQRTKSNARTQKQKKPSSSQAQRTAFTRKKSRRQNSFSSKNQSSQLSSKFKTSFKKRSFSRLI